ncbi:hypothetical protein E2542_SST17704 [Spatholobus suberectus]|nr:hypothetical protein E2542_SST17704 [Spatholobus suberectus]
MGFEGRGTLVDAAVPTSTGITALQDRRETHSRNENNPIPPASTTIKHICGMDVFIPEEYVIKRRLEKKAATAAASASGKRSKSHSHRNSNATESTRNNDNASSSTLLSNGFGLVADNVVFGCLSA